jgi:hypothetical protein
MVTINTRKRVNTNKRVNAGRREMGHLTKEAVLLAFVVTSLVFYVFIFFVATNTITNVSAVDTSKVGVYWNSDCSDGVSLIEWGTLTPNSVKNIAVYIQNEVDELQFLSMRQINWNPSKASDYITLEWNYTGKPIDPGEVFQILLTLSVSRYIEGISNFSFDILITGSQNPPGDIDGNGRIDGGDIGKFYLIYSGFITDPILVARADINGDGKVTGGDVGKLDLIYSGFL